MRILYRVYLIAFLLTVFPMASPGSRPPLESSVSSSAERVNQVRSESVRSRHGSFGATSVSSLVRTASSRLLDMDPPAGVLVATAHATCKAPSLKDIRYGSYGPDGWTHTQQQAEFERRISSRGTPLSVAEGPGGSERRRRLSRASSFATTVAVSPSVPPVLEEVSARESPSAPARAADRHIFWAADRREADEKDTTMPVPEVPQNLLHYTNGYTPPPRVPWSKTTAIALKAFWRWFITVKGFLITLYGLNVIAWGGMLFLLLVNAAPAMCRPSCAHPYSPRRIWLEIDAQILNGLFCVTGLGLIPWRFKELYFIMKYRLHHDMYSLRRLGAIYCSWFRLPGSDLLDTPGPDGKLPVLDETNLALPLPLSKTPDPPLTGVRAPPTSIWKLDVVIWMNVWNTFFQIGLCGVMWGLNRFDRPAWTSGGLIALACIVSIIAGIVIIREGNAVKRVEGVLPAEVRKRIQDAENDASLAPGKVDPNWNFNHSV